MSKLDVGRNEIKTQEKGIINLKSNDCCNCKEGCVLGKNVYCSLDGRFHPLRDNITCKKFIPK